MELSTGGGLLDIRKKVCNQSKLSVGSVPLYQAFIEAARKKRCVVFMDEDDLFNVTEKQAKLGTNFMAIHTGINYETIKHLELPTNAELTDKAHDFGVQCIMEGLGYIPLYRNPR